MEQDSVLAFRIPQYLVDKQNIFFIKFIQQQDQDLYYKFSSNQGKIELKTLTEKTVQLSKQKNYFKNRPLTAYQLLKSHSFRPIESNNKQFTEDWFSLSILTCLLLFSITRFFYFKRLGQIFSSLFINRVLTQINRESDLKKEGISFLLILFFLISTSLFLFKVSVNYFDFSFLKIDSTLTFFFFILLVVFLFYFIKLQLIRFIGYVFNTQTETNDYILYYLIFLLVFGTILLIPVIIQSYISYKIGFYLAVFFFLMSEGFRIIKAIISLFSYSKFSILFIFLYLCTVEIIPVMIVYKVLLNFIKT